MIKTPDARSPLHPPWGRVRGEGFGHEPLSNLRRRDRRCCCCYSCCCCCCTHFPELPAAARGILDFGWSLRPCLFGVFSLTD